MGRANGDAVLMMGLEKSIEASVNQRLRSIGALISRISKQKSPGVDRIHDLRTECRRFGVMNSLLRDWLPRRQTANLSHA